MSNITSLQIGQKTLNIGKSVLLKSYTNENSGMREIRTLEPFRIDGLVDRWFQPLTQHS